MIESVVPVVVTLLRRVIEPACFLGTLGTGLQRNSQREWRKTRRRNLRLFRRAETPALPMGLQLARIMLHSRRSKRIKVACSSETR